MHMTSYMTSYFLAFDIIYDFKLYFNFNKSASTTATSRRRRRRVTEPSGHSDGAFWTQSSCDCAFCQAAD